MKAYLIFDIMVTDDPTYAEYRHRGIAAIEKRIGEGRVIVRGGSLGTGKTKTMEGDWMPDRLIIMEFPSTEAAQAFYESPEYQDALALRLISSQSRALLVEGVD